jgi:hypothetical protein
MWIIPCVTGHTILVFQEVHLFENRLSSCDVDECGVNILGICRRVTRKLALNQQARCLAKNTIAHRSFENHAEGHSNYRLLVNTHFVKPIRFRRLPLGAGKIPCTIALQVAVTCEEVF